MPGGMVENARPAILLVMAVVGLMKTVMMVFVKLLDNFGLVFNF